MADAPEERNACNRALLLGKASLLLFFRHREYLSIYTISMSSYERRGGVVLLAVCRRPADGLLDGMLERTGNSSGLNQGPVWPMDG